MQPNATWYANSQRIRILMMSVISGHESIYKDSRNREQYFEVREVLIK